MAYLVPNATDTGNAARFADANQAEPDSLDLEALGLRSNWVRDGGVVTYSSGKNIAVTGGTVVIGNRPYTFASVNSVTITDASASNSRFDAVVARLNTSASTVSVQVVLGTQSATNPTLPRSRSVLATGVSYNSTIHVDPDTDVMLATTYKVGTDNLSAGSVVDKRIYSATQTTTWVQSTAPTNSTPARVGDMAIHEGDIYLCVSTTSTPRWRQMAKSDNVADFVLPVGAIFAWAGGVTDPPNDGVSGTVRYLPCDGRTLSQSEYSVLYGVIEDTFGGSNTTFNLPDIRNNTVISGVAKGNAAFGEVSGSNTFKLTETQLPIHDHGTHNHGIRVRDNATAGGSAYVMAANGSSGTENSRNSLTTQLSSFGSTLENQQEIDVRGKRINLTYFIRVK